jgi:hypothetical protein
MREEVGSMQHIKRIALVLAPIAIFAAAFAGGYIH